MVGSAVLRDVFGDLLPGYLRETLILVESLAAIVKTIQLSGDDLRQQLDLPHNLVHDDS